MLDLLRCEAAKLRRKPLFVGALFLSALMPLAFTLLLSDAQTSAAAVEDMMSSLFQFSAYLLLLPVLVILAAHLLFLEQDNDTLKNLLTVPVGREALVGAKLLLLLGFSVLFMAVGALCGLGVLLLQGWEPVGFWRLFWVGIGEGVMMWTGALPCILLVIALRGSNIVSVILTFFYTTVNYLLSTSDRLLMQPFGLNPGSLLPGTLSFRWLYPLYDLSDPSPTLAQLLEKLSPYFLTTGQAFTVVVLESLVFFVLIALVYRRRYD